MDFLGRFSLNTALFESGYVHFTLAIQVIGVRGTARAGSLADFGVSYRKVDLADNGRIDWEALAKSVGPGEHADNDSIRGNTF